MSLVRVWRPSPNFSGNRARNQVVVLHTSEGAQTEASLAAFLAQPSSRVSYNVCFDNLGDNNTITECVRPPFAPWAAMAANNWGPHGCLCTPSGASANWRESDWMARPTMLTKAARWVREECDRYGIPVRFVDGAAIRRGDRGVCGHNEVTQAGAGGSHFDPGPRFVWSELLRIAGGGQPQEDDLTEEERTWLADSVNFSRDTLNLVRDIHGGWWPALERRVDAIEARLGAIEGRLPG